MSDLIERQDAINAIRALEKPAPTAQHLSAIYDCEDVITSLQSAQPEIIRCQDCIHKPTGTGVNHDIEFPDDRCPCYCEDHWYSWMPHDDWYCGSGERKTDG